MSSTSVTTVIESGDETSPFMLPGMAGPEHLTIDAGTRVVRFDRQCVLIPENPKPKRSMVVTRAYSLPLWKRRGHQSDFEAPEESTSPSASPPTPENTRIIIKVPIPTFRRRSSRSPPRGRSVSTSPTMPNRLTPCLVHREPSTSPEVPCKVPSRPSLPIYHRRQNDITIPLRECCQACERITEECIREGDLWKEQFSRGARRRRSVSLDQHDSLANMHYPPMHLKNCAKVYSGVLTEDETFAGPRCKISLTVDEVDKRRKAFEFAVDRHQQDRGSPPSPGPSSSFNSHERDVSSSSTTSSLSHSDELIPDILDSRHCLRASPIEEEDEAELFPLPRRTPSASPSPRASPSPSPNGSTSHLPVSVVGLKLAAACSSKESIASRDSSSQEGLLKASLTRKLPGGVGLGFPRGTLQASAKGSSLATTASTSAATLASSRFRPLPPLPKLPDSDSGSSSSSSASKADAQGSPFPAITVSEANPSSTNTSAPSSSPPTRFEQPPIFRTSSSPTPPPKNTPQSLSSARRKLSITAPFVKAGGTIKGVSVDVLKGVSSISAAGAPF